MENPVNGLIFLTKLLRITAPPSMRANYKHICYLLMPIEHASNFLLHEFEAIFIYQKNTSPGLYSLLNYTKIPSHIKIISQICKV